ncbi:hypothetical protein [Streptomyces monomycini]|uniref:hypothetical protein n=1 Tax=Streptomyces monomycini TaxID=371720 RepID=UPI001EEB054B|nr:hypothetical protein [Streptomyces monomycini]
MSCADAGERIEHVEVHDGPPLTIGLFLAAESIEQAERTAYAVVRRALDRHPGLAQAKVVSCLTPLVAPFYEGLLAPSPYRGGLLRPQPDPDSPEQ